MTVGLDRRGCRGGRSRERRAYPVTCAVENVALVAYDRAPHDGLVDGRRLCHGGRVFLPRRVGSAMGVNRKVTVPAGNPLRTLAR
jgi:hypothetical protein